MMSSRFKRIARVAMLAASVSMVAQPALAHCPEDAFDQTVFAPIHPGGMRIGLEAVASGMTAPLKGVAAPGEPSRLYVHEQTGKLWAVNLATGAKTLFLDVGARLVTLGVLGPNTFDERGLIGVAFHPDYASNGKLYTYTSEPNAGPPTFPTTMPAGSTPDHQNVIAEWQANEPGNPAAGVDPASRRELIRVDWPQFNHDAGDINFGPDGMLYIPMGDGGGADDADGQLFTVATGSLPPVDAPIVGHQGDGNAQKLNTPLGKILRIDVNGNNSANGAYGIPADNPFVGQAGAVAEIYALGFRNPFRLSFDSASGALFVGDVGQNDIEEVDIVVSGGNYGWNKKEGSLFFVINGNDEGFATTTPPAVVPTGLIDPIAQYDTHHEGHSVIGGFVYHGERIPQLKDRYVFGEFSRVFNFPSGPHNFGRLLYVQQKKESPGKLLNVQELGGFADAIASLGLATGTGACNGRFPPTLAVLGMGQDAAGELYVTGNISGLPFGTGGVVLRLAPKR
jgi:glucose/arabinose dehydrogenase